MRRNLMRGVAVGALVSALVAALAGVATAAGGHGRIGPVTIRNGVLGQQGGGFGFGFGFGMAPMPFAGPMGGPGMRLAMGPGGGGLLGADVLTPAASYLGISVSTLASDLSGGKTLAQEATAKGKTAQGLIDAIVAAEKTNLDNEKAAGWLTADQETSLLDGLTREITTLVNNGPPIPQSRVAGNGPLQTAATYLGISASDLQSDLKSGKSLADVVSSVGNGKTVDGLVAALLAPAKSSLDAAVTAGRITQSQENTLLTNLTDRLKDFVNNTKPTQTQVNSARIAIGKFAIFARPVRAH